MSYTLCFTHLNGFDEFAALHIHNSTFARRGNPGENEVNAGKIYFKQIKNKITH